MIAAVVEWTMWFLSYGVPFLAVLTLLIVLAQRRFIRSGA